MNTVTLATFIVLIILGVVVFDILLPWLNRGGAQWLADVAHKWVTLKGLAAQIGGYVHDTAMAQYIPPTLMMGLTGTYSQGTGAVSGTIAFKRAAAASTGVITIPITLPSNSVAQKGAYLKSIEVDYELLLAAATSITASINKVTRGADTAVAVVAAVTVTQDLAAATAAATQDQHRLTVALTTPVWIDNEIGRAHV